MQRPDFNVLLFLAVLFGMTEYFGHRYVVGLSETQSLHFAMLGTGFGLWMTCALFLIDVHANWPRR